MHRMDLATSLGSKNSGNAEETPGHPLISYAAANGVRRTYFGIDYLDETRIRKLAINQIANFLVRVQPNLKSYEVRMI